MRLAVVALIAAFALPTQPLQSAPAPEFALPKGVLPVTAVYLAKGLPDSCGRGCDRWIAVEGKIDAGAAERLRKLYATQKAASLPIYLHSPGGDVRQGLALGRLLRAHKATARVARTVVKECGLDGQGDAACLKLKQSGRELEAELVETGAFCNSSCTYALVGAATREIGPESTIGVHSARVTVSYSSGRLPSKAIREQFASRAVARGEHDIADYLVAMGIDRRLFELIKTVKFEQMHALRRAELLRFGIDKRELVETSWRFVDRGERFSSYVDKIVQQRDDNQPQGTRVLRWRVGCTYSGMRIDYARSSSEALAYTAIRFGADQKITLVAGRSGQAHGARVDASVVDQLKSASQMSLTKVLKDPNALPRETIMSTDGLSRAADQLARTCRSS